MNHWMIGDGELRRQVGMQAERYRELRRRSEEIRLLEAALGPRRSSGKRLRSWLQALWSHVRHTDLGEPGRTEALNHRRG